MLALSKAIYNSLNENISFEDRIMDDIIKNYITKEHNKIINKFPVWIDIPAYYEIHDYIYSKALIEFGLPEGECTFQDVFNKPCGYADEIGINELCDLVQAKTRDLEEQNLLLLSIKERLNGNNPCYSHSHIGDWMVLYLDKIGVDNSYERYYFKSQQLLDIFLVKLLLPDYEILN